MASSALAWKSSLLGCGWRHHRKPGQLGLSISLLSIPATTSIFFYIQINFLIFMWKPKTGLLFCFFFVFAPSGRSSINLPIASEPPLLSKPFHKKKKKPRLTVWCSWQRLPFPPFFFLGKKSSPHWDNATECWVSVLRSAHLRAPLCFTACR